MPRARNPTVAMDLIEIGARVLAEEGRPAVTARRLAAEVGTSTMAVYTNFGSMDELFVQMCREGFARFSVALEGPADTADPVADWVAQGWSYRRFALDDPHLYRVMFGDLLAVVRADLEAADAGPVPDTFGSLLRRLQRCIDAGRMTVDDLHLAGEAVWSAVHGHMTIELGGYFDAIGRDPVRAYAEGMRLLGLGLGDEPRALERSMRAARRRSGSLVTGRPPAAGGSARRVSGR